MPIKMDIGTLSNRDTVFKRKFRWTFVLADREVGTEGVVSYGGSTVSGHICKISSRPVITFDEQKVQHAIEVINLPAKAQWDSSSNWIEHGLSNIVNESNDRIIRIRTNP